MADSANMEKEQIVECINSWLAEACKKGKILGRKKGTIKAQTQFLKENKKVADLLRSGHSLRNIEKIAKVSRNTVNQWYELQGRTLNPFFEAEPRGIKELMIKVKKIIQN